MEHKLLEHNFFFFIIGVKRTFSQKNANKNENVHEMGRRASKMDFSHTKMRVLSRPSSWWCPFLSKTLFLKSLIPYIFIYFFVPKKFVFVLLFGPLENQQTLSYLDFYFHILDSRKIKIRPKLALSMDFPPFWKNIWKKNKNQLGFRIHWQ